MIIAKFVAVVLLGYFLGSIPFGLLIGRQRAGVDITEHGSGKTGATNVLRTAGKKAAAISAILDILKGVAAVLLAGLIFGDSYLLVGGISLGTTAAQVMAALAALAGHNFSVFLKFRGGRGVAVFFGGLLALCWPAALFAAVVFFSGAAATRYASLGSIAGAVGSYVILVPLYIMKGYPVEYLFFTLIGAIVIIAMHRDNIARLVSGTERKIGDKAKKKDLSPSMERMG